jgi:hypothetical protein
MKVAFAAAASMLVLVFSFDVQAFPSSPTENQEMAAVTLIRDSCGKGNHRTRAGQCVSGGQEKAARESYGVNGTTCPPGTRLGVRGRNCQRID